MLQINAPELAACGGEWARAALANFFLRPGTLARLDYDAVTTDQYDRTLAAPIVTGTDGADYNISIVMVYVGLAKAAYYGDNAKYLDWANASEAWAKKAQWNMWAPGGPFNGGSNCGTAPAPSVPASTATPPSAVIVPPPPPPGGNCNPNYSGACLDKPGDYDCAGGSGNGPNYTGTVTVIGVDVYDLDRDNDGIGCE